MGQGGQGVKTRQRWWSGGSGRISSRRCRQEFLKLLLEHLSVLTFFQLLRERTAAAILFVIPAKAGTQRP